MNSSKTEGQLRTPFDVLSSWTECGATYPEHRAYEGTLAHIGGSYNIDVAAFALGTHFGGHSADACAGARVIEGLPCHLACCINS